MIELLRIENVAIVDRAELEFGPGLNVLTGETGAGKSIVLSALALLSGARARADAIRDGCEAASVEAVFRTEGLPELEELLAARGLAPDDHELIVQRRVARAGRGRARVSGQLLPVGQLAELFQGRIEISSQHDSQALLRPEMHGLMLDRAGGLLARRAVLGEDHRRLRELERELSELRAAAQERERRRDFLAFQVAEIDAARLDPAEEDALVAEHSRLAHASRLRDEGARVLAGLAGDPLDGEAPGAADLLGEAIRRLEALGDLDPRLVAPGERLQGLASELRDAATEIERLLDGVEEDPARLAALDERIQQIEQLKRKYGSGVEEVLRFRDEAAAELEGAAGAEAREAELAGERDALLERLREQADGLSRGRVRAARRLARAVQARLGELAMAQARFEVALESRPPPEGLPCGPTGAEAAEFRFSANAGEALRPFQKVVSGGELSRVLLALRSALRDDVRGMVLVFDEVDAGVGGRAADRVGRALAELATHHQVLCITHLPQIAAFARVHFRVEKRERAGRTLARVHRVAGAERVEEIARMAGGERIGEATRRHARELLAARSPE